MRKNKETHNIEYKRELNEHFEKVAVSFLNSRGGDIYIGIDDDGNIIGVKNADKTQLKIKDILKNNISPSVLGLFDVMLEEIDNKKVIKVKILEGTERPYYIKKYGLSEKGCFIRNGNASDPMPQSLIDKLYASRNKNSLSQIISPIQTLKFEQLQIYYQEVGLKLNKNFYNFLELLRQDKKFNYIAYLLSDNNNISIRVAKYSSLNRRDLVENNEFGHCCIVKAAKQVLDKLQIENKTLSKITDIRRKDEKLVHPIALREAVMNAFIHNDYTTEEAPKFEIFPDRIEITSYGGLPVNITKKEFFNGYSALRNREIMRVFRDLELAEYLGSGIPRILSFYPKSIFKVTDNFIRVVFPFPVVMNFIENTVERTVENTVKKNVENTVEMNVENTVVITVEKDVDVYPENTRDKIIYAIQKNPYVTIKDLEIITHLTRRGVEYQLNYLKSKGIIKRIGSDKNGYWIIKKIHYFDEKWMKKNVEKSVENSVKMTVEKNVEMTVEKNLENTVENSSVKNINIENILDTLTLSKLSETAKIILNEISKNPNVTIKELMQTTQLSRRGIEYNLKKLKDNKIIKRIGSDRSGYWIILKQKH
jgi:predicted HTH transcriptional regulator